jgi:hypothetical protein
MQLLECRGRRLLHDLNNIIDQLMNIELLLLSIYDHGFNIFYTHSYYMIMYVYIQY